MATFGSPKTILGTAQKDAEASHIAAAGRNFYIIWYEPADPTLRNQIHEVYFSRSTDRGSAFSPRVNLSNSPGRISDGEVIAVRGANIYVARVEEDPVVNNKILFRRSTNNVTVLESVKTLSGAGNPWFLRSRRPAATST
ncbi:MAG: hypothetical protein ACRDTH_10985 [Pseudonocardiaceae bacterium]